ncbi:sodium-coupled neutral amino acid transporter 9 [Ixodes scapularis]|uniref:sodium-coupled neutral amino acid transporter 9 n=1 Tax=Ixodes scapularis TaxID=6945 RepID=UPI001C385419|nr:sodium-coupled neutral amino acid transporter 9 [Ixodes scapularis]
MDDDERAPLLQTPVNQAASESLRSNRSACSSTSEALSSQSVRKPFHYPVGEQGRVLSDPDLNAAATYSRYRYYNKLVHPATQLLAIPDHVVPAYFLVPFFNTEVGGEQSSLVTIFAIWNTMMGTSLLSMPWAISQAGFATGTLLILAIGGLCLYTAFRVLDSTRLAGPPGGGPVEFSDVCRHLLGPWGERLAMAFSLLPLLGACVVFWVLMATFLSGTALFLHSHIAGTVGDENGEDLICRHAFNGTLGVELSPSSVLESKYTMPLALVVLLFPVINLKSPSFFYKFNALGTVSVFYLLIYILINAFTWGINVDFVDETSTSYVPLFRTTFPALTGVLCLSFFIHNCVISMMRNQKNPEHNVSPCC